MILRSKSSVSNHPHKGDHLGHLGVIGRQKDAHEGNHSGCHASGENEMKTIEILKVLAESISVCSNLMGMISEGADEREDSKFTPYESLTVSNAMTVYQKLYAALPEAIQEESITEAVDGFYLHLFKKEGAEDRKSCDTESLRMAVNKLHSWTYTQLNTARDAIKLYG